MNIPERLFKYMPSQFVDRFVSRGDLLFRNLSYFRRVEEVARGDYLEGLHIDYPDNDITISDLAGKVLWKGRAAFINAVNADRILVFCLSELLSPELYQAFGSDACVEITDPEEFVRRCESTVGKQERFRESGLLHRRVEYFDPREPAIGDIKDSRTLPFFKHYCYESQAEYRLVAALKGGLVLTQQIRREVDGKISFADDLCEAKDDERHVFVGPLDDIVKVHSSGGTEVKACND